MRIRRVDPPPGPARNASGAVDAAAAGSAGHDAVDRAFDDAAHGAVDGACAVLTWARAGRGAPPRGVPFDLDKLLQLDSATRGQLVELAALHAARLQLGDPPLDDSRALGTEAVFLAAAVSLRDRSDLAGELARAVRPVKPSQLPAWELIARDAIVGPALARQSGVANELSNSLIGELCAASPLTAARWSPLAEDESEIARLLGRLCDDWRGRALLVTIFCQPQPCLPPATVTGRRSWHSTMAWRAGMLQRWIQQEREDVRTLVYEVYEAAMACYRAPTMSQIERARSLLLDLTQHGNADTIEDARAVARFWQPLAYARRARLDELRTRHYLPIAILEAASTLCAAARPFGQPQM
ncbi:MAG: hypothetical protein MJE77_36985 [Proteobacteria bacterium]|nr:hypothetical protein [Pseudomonadota bacterium]